MNDPDGDGLDDAQELAFGSNPLLADTDNDRLLDGSEIDPTADFDRDGIPNILDPTATTTVSPTASRSPWASPVRGLE